MSFQLVCDICGKNSGRDKAVFTNSLEAVVENYSGEEYKVMLSLGLQHVKDAEFMNKIQNSCEEEIIEMSEQEDLTIKNPDPHICLACQRGLAWHLLREGMVDRDTVYRTEAKVKLKAVDQFGNSLMFDSDFDDHDFDEDDDD